MGHTCWDVSWTSIRPNSIFSYRNPSLDNEFTQLMKGLQGERLRQAFHYLDKDEDGFIKPDEFKRIILVCPPLFVDHATNLTRFQRKLLDINYLTLSLTVCPPCAL